MDEADSSKLIEQARAATRRLLGSLDRDRAGLPPEGTTRITAVAQAAQRVLKELQPSHPRRKS